VRENVPVEIGYGIVVVVLLVCVLIDLGVVPPFGAVVMLLLGAGFGLSELALRILAHYRRLGH